LSRIPGDFGCMKTVKDLDLRLPAVCCGSFEPFSRDTFRV
jgi:hypothetical protein